MRMAIFFSDLGQKLTVAIVVVAKCRAETYLVNGEAS